jgi:hypothetical protein
VQWWVFGLFGIVRVHVLHPLSGPFEKLRRAAVRIQDLDRQIDEFRFENKYGIVVSELEPCGEYYALRAVAKSEPPLEWGVIVGEIAHNLRSALDNLMWQLIIANGLDPENLDPKKPYPAFPIFKFFKDQNGSGFCNEGVRHVARLRPEHAKWIEENQPYNTSDVNQSCLWLLHEINNADKHRVLQVAGSAFGRDVVVIGGAGDPLHPENVEFLPDPLFLVNGAKVGKVHGRVLGRGKPQYLPTTEIAFQSGCLAVNGMVVNRTVMNIWNHVSEIVCNLGSAFYPVPESVTAGIPKRIVHLPSSDFWCPDEPYEF